MQLFYWMLALMVGMGAAIQAAINARLAHGLGEQPVVAAFLSFLVGTLCLGAVMLYQSNINLAMAQLPAQPWWRWLGGMIGAAFVFSTVLLAPKIGLLNMLFLVILGQLAAGMAIDAFGLLQMPVRPLTWQKYAGLGVMMIGLMIFTFGDKLPSMPR